LALNWVAVAADARDVKHRASFLVNLINMFVESVFLLEKAVANRERLLESHGHPAREYPKRAEHRDAGAGVFLLIAGDIAIVLHPGANIAVVPVGKKLLGHIKDRPALALSVRLPRKILMQIPPILLA